MRCWVLSGFNGTGLHDALYRQSCRNANAAQVKTQCKFIGRSDKYIERHEGPMEGQQNIFLVNNVSTLSQCFNDSIFVHKTGNKIDTATTCPIA